MCNLLCFQKNKFHSTLATAERQLVKLPLAILLITQNKLEQLKESMQSAGEAGSCNYIISAFNVCKLNSKMQAPVHNERESECKDSGYN